MKTGAEQTRWKFAELAAFSIVRRRRLVLVPEIAHLDDGGAAPRALAVAHVHGRLRTLENDELIEHVSEKKADHVCEHLGAPFVG
jgi:hypothetical protein